MITLTHSAIYIYLKDTIMNLMANIQQELQEHNFAIIFQYPIITILFSFALTYVINLKLFRSPQLNLPPSPKRLPVIGNLHQLGPNLHASLRSLSAKFGPLTIVHIFNVPTLVVSSEKASNEIMNGPFFQNRPRTKVADALFYRSNDVAFSPYGDYWREAKKVSVSELFSPRRVRDFWRVREAEVEEMCAYCTRNQEASINIREMLYGVANNIVSRSAVGLLRKRQNGGKGLGYLARKATGLIGEFSFEDFIPFLGWIDYFTGLDSRLKETVNAIDELLDQVIEEHKQRDSSESDEKDLVDVLLRLQNNAQLGTNLNLKAILLDMFIGGTDNNSTTMEWAMAELVKNPALMKKTQDEIRRIVGNKPRIEEADIDQMVFLKCVIKETFRLHAPLIVARESTVATQLEGYDIPPKMRVLINNWAIHRDPKLWERSEEFVPERFEKNDEVDLKGRHSHFIPFGSGRRKCPGISFSMAEIECVLANLLCWFDWKLPQGQTVQDLDMSDVYSELVIRKKVPLHLVPMLHCSLST